MILYLLGALFISLVLTAVFCKLFIPVLMSKKMGQPIREIGPRWHKSKEGTPVMGGLFFAAAIFFALLLSFFLCDSEGLVRLWLTYTMALLFALVGIIDDSKKLFEHSNDGLRAYQKILLQLVISGLYLFAMEKTNNLVTRLDIPFFGVSVDFGAAFYFIIIAFMIVTVNSVNLTDGIDGLCSSVSSIVFLFFCVVSLVWQNAPGALFSGAALGGCIGFLIYNAHPARIFMGDTGSMFLGGAVIGAAFLYGSPLIVIVVGIIYFIEALSVIIQVTVFKLSGKKQIRVFKMSPIHHHFEMSGWSENKIVTVAVLITFIFCALTYFLA